MKLFYQIAVTAFFSLLFSACGNPGREATVTLMTGLEKSELSDLMTRFSSPRSFAVTSPSNCLQTQILVGFRPHVSTLNSDQDLTTAPVWLQTPISDGSANTINLYPGTPSGPSAWLRASTLKPIVISVPVGVLLDIGISGTLSVSSRANDDGTCPVMSANQGIPNPTFSLVGKTQTLITRNQTIPLRLWVADAQPLSADVLPLQPQGCISTGVKDYQRCPNQNFKRISISHCTTSATGSSLCSSLLPAGQIEVRYSKSSNGLSLGQRINLNAALTSLGIVVPNQDHYQITLLDRFGTAQETADWFSAAPSPAPPLYFKKMDGSMDLASLNVMESDASAVTLSSPTPTPVIPTNGPPGPFSLTINTQNASGIPISWTPSTGADFYSVATGTAAGGPYSDLPSYLNMTTTSASLTVGAGGVATGISSFLLIRAHNGNGITQTPPIQVLPLAFPATPLFTSATGRFIIINGLGVLGAASVDIFYGISSTGPFPSEVPTYIAPYSGAASISGTLPSADIGNHYFKVIFTNPYFGSISAFSGVVNILP